MVLQLIYTADGSHSIYLADLNEHYHSIHGAIQESLHVFIKAGFHASTHNPINILEIGLGTGLNCLLTFLDNNKQPRMVNYTTIEKFPLNEDIYKSLNYPYLLNTDTQDFLFIHQSPWEVKVSINEYFSLTKHHISIHEWQTEQKFHIIYFDAFAPNKQPDMWTEGVFLKLFEMLYPSGFLVTYCAKGMVKRTLHSIGFEVQTLPGPPGKREMIRAVKPN